jgi:hypothetical protein
VTTCKLGALNFFHKKKEKLRAKKTLENFSVTRKCEKDYGEIEKRLEEFTSYMGTCWLGQAAQLAM